MIDEDGWRRATEHLFQVLTMPQEGRVKLFACMRYLETSTPEYLDAFPREYHAVVVAAIEEGATWKQVARAARIGVTEAQRRWATVGSPPVLSKRRLWRRSS